MIDFFPYDLLTGLYLNYNWLYMTKHDTKCWTTQTQTNKNNVQHQPQHM